MKEKCTFTLEEYIEFYTNQESMNDNYASAVGLYLMLNSRTPVRHFEKLFDNVYVGKFTSNEGNVSKIVLTIDETCTDFERDFTYQKSKENNTIQMVFHRKCFNDNLVICTEDEIKKVNIRLRKI